MPTATTARAAAAVGAADGVRLLVASPFLPHAGAAHGGGVYLAALLGELATRAEVALVTFATRAEIDARRKPCAGLARVDILAHPTLGERSGIDRLACRAGNLARWLGGSPLVAAKFRTAAMRARLARTVAEFRPDVCLVEFALMAQYLPALAGAVRVLTDHEAGSGVPGGFAPGGFGAARDARLWARYVEREYAAADLVQALNADDARALGERLGREVAVRPAVVPIPADAVEPGAAPPRALLLGDWSHHPNPEAARFLVREVWPQVVAALPAAELWLAGPRGDETAMRVLAREGRGVSYRGFVPDLGALLSAVRCVAAPVLSGAGSRIKVLTALAHGLPVVANDLGLRGVDAPRSAVRRAESAAALASSLVDLLASADAAAAAGRAAREWSTAAVSPAAVADAQIARCRGLLAGRSSGR